MVRPEQSAVHCDVSAEVPLRRSKIMLTVGDFAKRIKIVCDAWAVRPFELAPQRNRAHYIRLCLIRLFGKEMTHAQRLKIACDIIAARVTAALIDAHGTDQHVLGLAELPEVRTTLTKSNEDM